MNRLAAALAAASFVVAAGAFADTAFELAFRSGSLDGFETGERLDYASAVTLPAGGEADAATVSVNLEGAGMAALEERREGGDAARRLGEFDADVGNPLGMYFLERTIRSLSEQTGGSVFYLRNRIKDALREPEEVREVDVDWHGQSVDVTEIVLAPFEGDEYSARLGPYADLRIRMVVGEDVPGWYHTLRAESGNGAYASTLTLMEVVE